jgi:hypothetical protein
MPDNKQNQSSDYDPRWFIWAIVFLVVTGISLISYIVFSDSSINDVSELPKSKTLNHQAK